MTAPISKDAERGRRAVDIRTILAPVRAGLGRVETKMKGLDSSLFAPLSGAFVDLIGSGGKRLRPALALMSAEFGGAQFDSVRHEKVISLAVSVEMLHTATLVHDDVIDNALLRRGAPTLNATWSKGPTVLAGNFMFGRAAAFAAETGNNRVIRLFSDTLQIIVNGELTQLFARHNYGQEKSSYYDRIFAKTASLFCAATEGAAVLAGLREDQIEQLRNYGYNLGMAFQIVDDILDFTGDEKSLGKPAGSDLRQGTLTLPFFYYLLEQPEPEQLVEELMRRHEAAEDGDTNLWRQTVAETVTAVRSSSAIAAAQQEAIDFLNQARSNLASLPDGIHKQSMLDLCDFVVQRTY